MDYDDNTYSRVFDGGITRQCYNIKIINDKTVEERESFNVTLKVNYLSINGTNNVFSCYLLSNTEIEIVDDRNECKKW